MVEYGPALNLSQQDNNVTQLQWDEDSCLVFRFVFYTIVIGLLSILGILGNILSIVVLQKDDKNRVATFLLQSLAIADCVVLMTSFFVLSIIYGLLPFAQHSDWAGLIIPYIVKYIHPVGYMGQCGTIWITVLLAINRFIAVVKPFLTNRLCTVNKAHIQVLSVTILAIVFNIPRFYQYDIIQEFDPPGSNHSVTVINDTVIGEYSLFGIIYTNIIYTVLVLIVPLVALVILNTWLVRELKSPTKTTGKRRVSLVPPRLPEEDNITLIMAVIIVVFLACHTPDCIFQIIRYFYASYEQMLCGETLYYVSSVCNLLIVINSSTNFIIYYMMRRRFRKILLLKLCAWRKLRSYKEPPSYVHPPPPLIRRHTEDMLLNKSALAEERELAGGHKVKLLLKTGSAPVFHLSD